jgi:Ca-activated chloride channel family protein
MTSPTDPTDRLLDSLLREQHRNAPDEALLRDIEAAIAATAATPAVVEAPAEAAPIRRRSYGKPLAAAAVLALSATAAVFWQAEQPQPSAPDAAALSHPEMQSRTNSAASTEVPKRTPLTRYAELWTRSTFTTPPKPADISPAAGAKEELRKIDEVRGMLSSLGRNELDERADELHAIIDNAENPVPSPPPAPQVNGLKPNPGPFDASGGFIVPGKTGTQAPAAGFTTDRYSPLVDQPWKSPWNDALSTFSIDVDAASYTNVRNMILSGRPVPPDAVRIEECINYFDYSYAGPKGDDPFALHGTLATCPWQPTHLLARVAIKGREIPNQARPASNLVFLIDVSGSMQDPVKLPLLKRSLRVLLDQLDERDHLGIVVYAGSEGVVLPPTTLDERGLSLAISALKQLEGGGSTNGGAGLKLAYAMATQNLRQGAINRVVLATDGDFNVGTTGQGELVALVKAEAAKGVSLSVLGFGTGNLNDAMMEAITNEGNGNYYYIDGEAEARRVFQQKLTGTLVTIAKDVKIQVEFNPGKVKAYRLIGYANRILRHEDFNNDKVDAGDIGAGHTVTAFYEIVPTGVSGPDPGGVDDLRYQRPANREAVASDDWFTLKLRHKAPEGDVSALIETTMKGEPQPWAQADTDFRFAAAVALFGMKLRQMPDAADIPWSKVEEIATPALTDDRQEQRAAFMAMIRKLSR